jgi:hypothetical protein
MLWTISNFLQIVDLVTLLELQFPVNMRTLLSATQDFINYYTFNPDILYRMTVGKLLGAGIPNPRDYKSSGLNIFVTLRGSNILRNLSNFFAGIVGLLFIIGVTSFLI